MSKDKRPVVQDPRLYAYLIVKKEMESMSKDKIPTAEEFLPETKIWDLMTNEKRIVYEAMREYAKLHVEAALKAFHEKAKKDGIANDADLPFILSAYPLDNIK